MTRITPLFKSSLLTIDRSDHPREVVHVDGRERIPAAYEITFVESGQFSVRSSSEICDFESGDIMLSSPGRAETVFHPATGAHDVCVGVKFHGDSLENGIGLKSKPAHRMKGKSNSTTAFQMQRIKQAVQTRNPLMIEELAIIAAHSFLPQSSRSEWASIDRNLAWYSRRVGRVCDFLNDEYVNSPSVSVLSEIAGISPFHFSRVFRYLTGLAVHQYVMKRQLVTAGKAITEGQSVTNAAFEAGFSSLSYFSRSFRRHFGSSPRTYASARRGSARRPS